MKKKYKITNKKILYKGFFNLFEYKLRHKKHNGSLSAIISREVFGGAQVSAVLPYDPVKKKIVLINQFRTGVIKNNFNPFLNEIVAGIIDRGETPRNAARRECFEEIGCKVKKLKKILSYFPAPASSESFYHIFLGEIDSFNGKKILGKEDENEDILANCYSISEVKKLLANNKIVNGLTLIALQWFFLNYNR